MRFVNFSSVLVYCMSLQAALGFEVEEHYVHQGAGANTLRIISTADAEVFNPIIEAFQTQYPSMTIDYTIASSTQLMQALFEEGAEFDLAISSAMDLQTKLANDGFVQTYRSEATDILPKWAKWRNQVFAFTQEPAVLVVSEDEFLDRPIPTTREDLITMLRDNQEAFSGRIGTYDVRKSGAGYLFATQDSRNTDSYWRLTEVMGRLNARLYRGSHEMIADVAAGRLALAYNVVGSYAQSQLADTPGIRIIEFDDYLSVMLRTALIPNTAKNPEGAGDMIDFLASLNMRADLTLKTNLPPINAQSLEDNSAARVIRLGPGLLVFLDHMTKETFLRSWENSIEQK
ncbi:ABC transporter substrate-binding protein [Falsihalocynthiibacter arcticus]|uniref:ABC transporter substrate-binding protein n=1 Tax=Falsihalocynthiibacter arcticus TaxID=1579316 RepID=A0A126UVF6_9RHOB|nr:extracellular solute-binding protein [Falsihalocynthiibacter arcticus]AML50024.1 ABC transporter substrate-binding protein [Falsihalocynthiibacter arcticus]